MANRAQRAAPCLAQLAELDRTYVSGVERGERNPSLANLLKLAAALDVSISAIAVGAERLMDHPRTGDSTL